MLKTTATIESPRELLLDEDIPEIHSGKVNVVVLFEGDEEISESDWTKLAMTGGAFDFLLDESEDIYTLADGKPMDEK
jgi:hypothetical protein